MSRWRRHAPDRRSRLADDVRRLAAFADVLVDEARRLGAEVPRESGRARWSCTTGRGGCGSGSTGHDPIWRGPAAAGPRRSQPTVDLLLVAVLECRPDSEPADALPRPVSAPAVRLLQEPVVGSAAAGGVQPATVDASDPGGQAAAEICHRWPGERAGLLEAQVVELQSGNFAVLPAADDRLGDLVRIHAEFGPGVLGPSAQLTGQVGHKYQLASLPFGVAGDQRIHQASLGLGNSRMQQGGRGDDQDGAGLGFASGSWRQQEAEVAVGDPARLQHLTERVRAELVHSPPPVVLAMDARGPGYPAHKDAGLQPSAQNEQE